MENILAPKIANVIMQSTRDGIFVTNTKNEIIYVNKSLCDVTGYFEEEVIGCNPRIFRSDRHDDAFYLTMWESLKTNGLWQGEIWDKRKNGDVYLEYLSIHAIKDDDGNVENYIAVISDINEQHKIEVQLDRATLYDVLTDLPNRTQSIAFLRKQLSPSNLSNKLLTVAVLDLDNFKSINDKFGHDFGDRLLIVITKRLKRLIRNTDMVSRFGGDEFSLIFCNLDNFEQVEQMSNRIISIVSAPIELDGKKYDITASLGLTIFPFDDVDAEMLLRHADQAMYNAKSHGKNRYHLFDIEKDQKEQTRRELLDEVTQALARNEFVLHYQPKVNLRTGKVIGAEALIRWQHPERGLLAPNIFLPHIEYHDLIIHIGEWVIREALKQLSHWISHGHQMIISVNIAARQILQDNFTESLTNILKEFPEIPLEYFEIEILESAALENTAHVQRVIKDCQKMGVHFALDDFGTGYASLSYLRDLPVDVLKIDQSFIFNLLEKKQDLSLVEGIIGLASAFHLTVIAEGVEKTEHGILLMRLGCDLVQGYGISKPMPAELFSTWIKEFKPDQKWSMWADTSWEMSDFPLLVAQHDHITWVKSILMYIEGKNNNLNLETVNNHHECQFGHWYDEHDIPRYNMMKSFVDIKPLHIKIHQLGKEIIKLCDDGNNEEARAKSSDLLLLKDKILHNLAILQNEVIERFDH